ncbi:MAG: VOC family protein [Actinobacteria bacterium]|nr:VOC family protein [Actinomycetota bacterium]
MSGLLRIDNLDVYCEDVPTLLRFYTEALGVDLLYPYTAGDDWFAIQSGDVTVYFLQGLGPAPVDRHPPVGEARGIASFSFAVDDLDAAIERLDPHVTWLEDVDEWRHENGTWYRFRFFTDPEGNVLSITEPHKVAPR